MADKWTRTEIARLGAVFGWLVLVLVVLVEIALPSALAGTRVSGTVDESTIRAYYRNETLKPLAVAQFAAVLVLPFALALREVLKVDERAKFLATLGLLFAVVEVPLLLARSSLQVVLVDLAVSGGAIVPFFRFWDVLYNSAIYAVEAGLIVSFGLAVWGVRPFPRWFPAYALVAAALQVFNMLVIFLGLSDSVTIVGNLGFVGWFVINNVSLGRIAKQIGGASA